MFSLADKVAIVTGSSRGIGLAIAEAMADAGARVVISSRKAEACTAAATALRARGRDAIAVPCNVSSREDVDRLIDTTGQKWGRVDILVCNAAINTAVGPMSGIDDVAFDKIMRANVRSTMWQCQRVLPAMAERRDGAIILISSVAGLCGTASIGVYALTKAADIQLARNLAVEWSRHNIRINAIAPGLIRTDMSKALWQDDTLRTRVEQRAPLGRVGEPADVAGVAVFLASPAARYITGQVIAVDGGVTIADML